MIYYLLWLITRYLLAHNPATTLVGRRSSYKMFSPKKSFSTHFHLKIFNKHPYNIKKKYSSINKRNTKQSKNTKSNKVRIFFLDLDLFFQATSGLTITTIKLLSLNGSRRHKVQFFTWLESISILIFFLLS